MARQLVRAGGTASSSNPLQGTLGSVAIMERVAEPDFIVTDPEEDVPACDRTPTRPLPPLRGARVEIDLADAESAASFLEMVAKIVRERRRIVIVVE